MVAISLDVKPDCIVSFLKRELQFRDLCQQILYREIVDAATEERGITVNDEEIQEEANQFRYQHKLESAAATFSWLDEQLITPEEWQEGIRDRLLAKKLSEALFEKDVPTYFAQNKVNYDKVILYRLIVPYEPLAQELFYKLVEEEISFYEASHLYDIDESRRLQCGYEGTLFRWNLKPDLAAEVFGRRPHDVIGPIPSQLGFELYMIENFISAELTPEIHQEILGQLFREWLQSEFNYAINNR